MMKRFLIKVFEGDKDAEKKAELSAKIWQGAAERYNGKTGKDLCDDLLYSLFAFTHSFYKMYPLWHDDFEEISKVVREDVTSAESEKDAVMLMFRAALTLFHTLFLMRLGNDDQDGNKNTLPYIW